MKNVFGRFRKWLRDRFGQNIEKARLEELMTPVVGTFMFKLVPINSFVGFQDRDDQGFVLAVVQYPNGTRPDFTKLKILLALEFVIGHLANVSLVTDVAMAHQTTDEPQVIKAHMQQFANLRQHRIVIFSPQGSDWDYIVVEPSSFNRN